MKTNEPLGLPRGSVRSILAILLTTAFICAAFGFVAAGLLDADKAFIGLLGLVTTVVNVYFATRANTPPAPARPLVVSLGEPKG